MPELKERFSLADGIGTRDLWGEARRRAAADAEHPVPGDPMWTPGWRRLGTAAVAFAVFAAAAVFAWNLSHLDPNSGPTPAVNLASELPEGWSELPAPPEVRSGAATAWTGSQLLVWGGYEYTGDDDDSPFEDALVFDAASRTWTRVPGGPLEARAFAGSAWTGSELLVWGGDDMAQSRNFFSDGAAYDPETRLWSLLPEAPIVGRAPLSVWTGEEFVVWGTAIRAGPYLDGAAYDPTTRSWRVIADAPIDLTDATAAWTGEEMIVFGAALDGNNRSDTPTAIGAAYDPETDTWRGLPPSELSPQAHTAEWVNGELIAWDYEHGTAAYDPGTNVWRALPKVPLSFSECGPESVATPQLVFGNYCGQTVVFSAEEDEWHRIPMPLPSESRGGCCWVHEPVSADGVVLVPSHLYGKKLEVLERRMFAYNPPPVVRTDPRGEVLEPEPLIPRTERDGDNLRMPIFFPDGSEAIVVYPIAVPLDLAVLGAQPNVSYFWRADPPRRYPIVFLHDRNASIAEYVEGTEPVGFVNSYRNIEIWNMSETWLDHRAQLQGGWLRIGLRSWTILIAVEEVADADRVAANIDVRETTTGFPVVDATGPIELAEGFGESEGATLSLGDGTGDPRTSSLDATIFLSPDGCSPGREISPSGEYGSSCLADGSVFASIYGDPAFVTAVVEGLSVEDFRQA